MRSAFPLLLLIVMLAATAGNAAAQSPQLAQARTLYNEGDYERAVAAALIARQELHSAGAAELVRARALLELFRQHGDTEYLRQAHGALAVIDAEALSARDRVDLLVGLGQWLFLNDDAGAAAEVFDSALGAGILLEQADRLLLLDWWASAVDREARTKPTDRRVRAYQRLGDRMEVELREDPGNPAANYWLAVAARGSGDIERAWDAAVAGWLRAALSPDASRRVRADLDRLVLDAIIPERARTYPAADREEARAALRRDWDRVKQQWPQGTP